MSDLSHEEIKNAIAHAGENEHEIVGDPSLDSDITIPEAPYDGFVGNEPTDDERVVFRAARDQVHARHRNRTPQNRENQTNPSRERVLIAGTVVGALFVAAGVGVALFRGNSSNDSEAGASTKPISSTSAGEKPGATDQIPKPASFELKITDPNDLTESVAAALADYVLEPDQATSEVMLQGLLGSNLDQDSIGQRFADIWRTKRDSLQSKFQVMKDVNDKDGRFVLTIENDSALTPEPDSGGTVTIPVSVTSETNLDEPPYNNPAYDTTEQMTLIASNDNGVYHLVGLTTN